MINELKDLEKLLKLCRRQGVSDMEIEGIKFKLGDVPQQVSRGTEAETEGDAENPYSGFPERILTNEELMFYSSGGVQGTEPPEAKQ